MRSEFGTDGEEEAGGSRPGPSRNVSFSGRCHVRCLPCSLFLVNGNFRAVCGLLGDYLCVYFITKAHASRSRQTADLEIQLPLVLPFGSYIRFLVCCFIGSAHGALTHTESGCPSVALLILNVIKRNQGRLYSSICSLSSRIPIKKALE